ncbi:MAG: hypothetical protein GX136_01590 [Clostridiales bacterium]|jgi:hypothetical protein|nr:hypothetical protein [Clostridiales bacterium]
MPRGTPFLGGRKGVKTVGDAFRFASPNPSTNDQRLRLWNPQIVVNDKISNPIEDISKIIE